MTTNEIKEILASKLHDEGCYFTKSDISVRKTSTGYKIVIKDYEHIPFKVTLEEDEYFGKCVFVRTDDETVTFRYSKKDYPMYEAMLSLGYYIGTRF